MNKENFSEEKKDIENTHFPLLIQGFNDYLLLELKNTMFASIAIQKQFPPVKYIKSLSLNETKEPFKPFGFNLEADWISIGVEDNDIEDTQDNITSISDDILHYEKLLENYVDEITSCIEMLEDLNNSLKSLGITIIYVLYIFDKWFSANVIQ